VVALTLGVDGRAFMMCRAFMTANGPFSAVGMGFVRYSSVLLWFMASIIGSMWPRRLRSTLFLLAVVWHFSQCVNGINEVTYDKIAIPKLTSTYIIFLTDETVFCIM